MDYPRSILLLKIILNVRTLGTVQVVLPTQYVIGIHKERLL